MHHHDVPDEDKTVVEAEMPVSSNIPGLNQALEAVSSLLSMIETLNLDTFVVQNAVKHTKEIQQILVDLRNSFQTYFESKDIDQADVSTLARDLVSPLIRLSSQHPEICSVLSFWTRWKHVYLAHIDGHRRS
ncbi:hypothetical protein CERSUDRAFT_72067 [Gelatoporia subvermispora B]|uniref:Uncharacterized protein n=1 Tax=Ceriporiopsis subvermispora (strain B) TaxID=914234 RepID=M2PQE8_CERS8|nr:hypothetical protein CERSUDRAFT_72067 [Gelatoporia subvermispora B]